MRYEEFSEEVFKIWNQYFAFISQNHEKIESIGVPLYPTQIHCYRTDRHFLFELIGANQSPSQISRKIHREEIGDFFNIFPENNDVSVPILEISGTDNGVKGVCLAHPGVVEVASHRFPIINEFGSTLVGTNTTASLINLLSDADKFIMSDCLIASKFRENIRCRFVGYLGICKESISKRDLLSWLNKKFYENFSYEAGAKRAEIVGIITARLGGDSLITMAAFQSLYLSKTVRENWIGEFLRDHPNFIESVFGATVYQYEPHLHWVEHNGDIEDTAINPDLLVQRSDGYYDIIDIKTAVLARRNITKGKRRRRRFIDIVSEGIAQLKHYEYYFSFEKNRKLAYEKYGVLVQEPRLILVVGHEENFLPHEVRQALAPYQNDKFLIIDYDTVARSLLGFKSK